MMRFEKFGREMGVPKSSAKHSGMGVVVVNA
jgi:hypothetical protein